MIYDHPVFLFIILVGYWGAVLIRNGRVENAWGVYTHSAPEQNPVQRRHVKQLRVVQKVAADREQQSKQEEIGAHETNTPSHVSCQEPETQPSKWKLDTLQPVHNHSPDSNSSPHTPSGLRELYACTGGQPCCRSNVLPSLINRMVEKHGKVDRLWRLECRGGGAAEPQCNSTIDLSIRLIIVQISSISIHSKSDRDLAFVCCAIPSQKDCGDETYSERRWQST